MTKVGVLVCLVIVAMDAIAGILGIKAEVAKNKVIHMRQMRNFGCKEPSPEAFKLGLAAAALQGLAHITASLLGGFMCICCTEDLERSASSRQFWFTCLILSWYVFLTFFPKHNYLFTAYSDSKIIMCQKFTPDRAGERPSISHF
ncbi:hypothetical protein Dsin_022863 [Dipteronia sinensis]|uniref:Uncharacterized protein n=1 Tax=Dipteronia sinensis TaxID=43782 RepID=A0AAE0E075_9ROSI|nr:hypothetical protein Dsin_022863 [Dipteronia sinensis]